MAGIGRVDPHTDDARLVARALAGEQGAFRRLFEAYSPLVYRIAFRMVGSADDAADLTQDVFVRAYERLTSLKDGQAFQAWITRLAVNMAHDRARKRRLPTRSLDAPPPGGDEEMEWQLSDGAPGQEARALRAELSAQVQQALLALPPDFRVAVVLHHLEEMPVEEIARLLRLPEGTVKSRLSRGRAALRRLLGEYVEG